MVDHLRGLIRIQGPYTLCMYRLESGCRNPWWPTCRLAQVQWRMRADNDVDINQDHASNKSDKMKMVLQQKKMHKDDHGEDKIIKK